MKINLKWKRLLFVVVFVVVFLFISFLSLLLAICTGLGPPDTGDPPVNRSQEIISSIGYAILCVLWFPINVIHQLFFKGRPLPGNDWFWLLGCGIFYGFAIMLIREWAIRRNNK